MVREQTRSLCTPHRLQPSRGLFIPHYVVSLTATTSDTTASIATTTTANSDSDSGSGSRVKFVTAAEAKYIKVNRTELTQQAAFAQNTS